MIPVRLACTYLTLACSALQTTRVNFVMFRSGNERVEHSVRNVLQRSLCSTLHIDRSFSCDYELSESTSLVLAVACSR